MLLATLLLVVSTRTSALQNIPDTRRSFVSQSIASVAAAFFAPAAFAEESTPIDGFTVFKLKSGLQFIDLKEGTGISPRYGQLCSIKYTAYLKLPNKPELKKFDSDVYLLKHGNGRLIAGLDEGLHTLKVGGSRRIIIPPKLGFTDNALGPVPQSPFDRRTLNKLLTEMVAQRGGNLIYDVEMVRVVDDEADQGYYEDLSLTEEQFNTLRDNIQAKAKSTPV